MQQLPPLVSKCSHVTWLYEPHRVSLINTRATRRAYIHAKSSPRPRLRPHNDPTILLFPPTASHSSSGMLLALSPSLAAGLATLFLAAYRTSATALTTTLAGNERSCFYADVDGAGEKVGRSILPSYSTPYRTRSMWCICQRTELIP
jgi:hypothetical protein